MLLETKGGHFVPPIGITREIFASSHKELLEQFVIADG